MSIISSIDISFWREISKRKLTEQKLSEDVYTGYASMSKNNDKPIISFTSEVLNDPNTVSDSEFLLSGSIVNLNTIEKFKNITESSIPGNLIDEYLKKGSKQLLESFEDGFSFESLNFYLFCFCNFKTHVYDYRFIYPCPKLDYYLKMRNHNYFFEDPFNDIRIFRETIGSLGMTSLSRDLTTSLSRDLTTSLSRDLTTSLSRDLTTSKSLTEFNPETHRNFYFPFANESMNPLLYIFCVYLRKIYGKETEIRIFTNKKEFCITLNKLSETEYAPFSIEEPKKINLSTFMDSKELAEESVNLNLQLMKWREWPEIDLDLFKTKKCLLIGAGTLGSSVARNLLGYGFRTINFVDNGVVSHSNPVRQSLYFFDDVDNKKAEVASETLRKIFPKVSSESYVITVPDAGTDQNENTYWDLKKLDNLIQKHDYIFLLTDTRESRWIPTVLAAQHNKLLMNAALSFDSFVVQRHPLLGETHSCYFCTDIMGPRNSRKNRTMDQQCTVTRPGLSDIAGSVLVSLLVSYLNNEPSHDNVVKSPTQIRGSLKDFSNQIVKTTRFDECIGCSEKHRQLSLDDILDSLKNPELLDVTFDSCLDFEEF
jgi:ubiquitin-like modifier-activating enzyme ATG7